MGKIITEQKFEIDNPELLIRIIILKLKTIFLSIPSELYKYFILKRISSSVHSYK